jgi:hypothetical protein
MREYWHYFWRSFIALFIIAFVVVSALQDAGDADSIGLWYTIHCAAGFSALAAVLALFGDTLIGGTCGVKSSVPFNANLLRL